ncbi:putative LOV domain-containing protein, variant 2 [Balamuthia mandrillaris]
MWLDHIDLGEYSRNAVKQKVTGQELMEDPEESIINKLHIEHTSEQTLLRAALKVIRTDTANCFSFFSCADSNLSPSSSSSPLHNITDFEKLSLESLKKYYAEAVQRLRQNRDGEGEGEEEKGSKKRKNGTQQHSPPKKLQWDARTFFHSSAERITKMTVRCIWKDELRLFSVAPDASLDRLKAKVSFIFEDILNGDSDGNGGDGWDRRASPIKHFFSEDQGQEENEEANCEIEKRECRRRKAKEKEMMVTEERYGTNAANERWCRWGGLSLASCLDETEEAKEEENEEREEEEEEEHKGKGKKERKDDERRTKRRKIDFDQNASAKSELVSKGRFKQGREEQKGEAQTADYYDGKLRSPDEGGPQGTEEELQKYRTTTNEAGSSGEENARLVGKSGEAFWLVAVDFRNKVLRSQADWEQVVSQIQLEDNCIRRKVVLRLVPALATYTTSPQPVHL